MRGGGLGKRVCLSLPARPGCELVWQRGCVRCPPRPCKWPGSFRESYVIDSESYRTVSESYVMDSESYRPAIPSTMTIRVTHDDHSRWP